MKLLKLDNNYKLASRIIVIVTITIIFLINLYAKNSKTINITLILILSLYFLILTRNNIYLFICGFFIAYSNYSILITHYIAPVYNSYFLSLHYDESNITGINIILVFMILIDLFLPLSIKSTHKKNNFIRFKNNNVIYILIYIVLCIILIFAFGRPDIEGERGEPSAFYEYSIILFIIAFYYAGNSKKKKIFLACLIMAFALQNFIFGGRITGIQLLLCYFLLCYAYKYSYKSILMYILIGIFFMSLIGIVRADWSSFKGFIYIFNQLKELHFSLDTATSSYFTSLTFVKFKNISSTHEIVSQFCRFLLSMLLGGNKVQGSNLASITYDYIVHYYGGVLPFFFYYWFGYLGVCIIGCIVSCFFKIINNIFYNKDHLRLLAIYISATVPRWYLYSPNNLFRGTFLFLLAFGIAYIVDILMKKKQIDGYVI